MRRMEKGSFSKSGESKIDVINIMILSVFFIILGFNTNRAYATPSTQIWNPSTDIQAKGIWHLGIDNYFAVNGSPGAFPTDIGLTYGATSNLEIGFDLFFPQANPLVFNAKLGLPESGEMPAVAVGGFGFGTNKNVTDQNVIYGVVAKTFPLGRLSAGYFSGNPNVLVDLSGAASSSGVILTWDKTLSDKVWASIDYAGSNSALGALFCGFSYAFSSNTSILFAYGTYNNGSTPTFTTQLDINI